MLPRPDGLNDRWKVGGLGPYSSDFRTMRDYLIYVCKIMRGIVEVNAVFYPE